MYVLYCTRRKCLKLNLPNNKRLLLPFCYSQRNVTIIWIIEMQPLLSINAGNLKIPDNTHMPQIYPQSTQLCCVLEYLHYSNLMQSMSLKLKKLLFLQTAYLFKNMSRTICLYRPHFDIYIYIYIKSNNKQIHIKL